MLDVSLVVMHAMCNTPLSYGWVGWGNSPTQNFSKLSTELARRLRPRMRNRHMINSEQLTLPAHHPQ